jgi:hypothetical protein
LNYESKNLLRRIKMRLSESSKDGTLKGKMKRRDSGRRLKIKLINNCEISKKNLHAKKTKNLKTSSSSPMPKLNNINKSLT